MAPNITDAAGHNHQPSRRQLSRIVPAIPHRLSRAAPPPRPVTPEESNKGAARNESGSREETSEEQASSGAENQTLLRAEEAPLTPDSRVSASDKGEAQTLGAGDPTTKSSAGPAQHPGSLEDCKPDQVNGSRVNVVANGVNRKLAVPAELPPPFYPANQMNARIPPAQETGHDHPGSNSLGTNGTSDVHGGAEQNSLAAQNGGSRLSLPPPGLAPEFFPSQNPGQLHHHGFVQSLPLSEPPHGATIGLHPLRNGTPANLRNGHGLPNGSESSHAHSPVKAHAVEQPRSSSDYGDDRQAVPYHQDRVPPQNESMVESPFELASYLSRQFGKTEFADYVLQVRLHGSVLAAMPAHGIVVARSPVVAEAAARCVTDIHRPRDTLPVLEITTADTFVSRESVEEAIRVLYGAPLLSVQNFLYGIAPPTNGSVQPPNDKATRRMRELLSYIAAGRLFQMPIMQHCGVEIVKMLLRWDTVEQVLRFGLRSSTGNPVSNNDFDFKDPFNVALLNYAVDFMAFAFPRDFKLFSIAPELQDAPRLPPLLDFRAPTHHARLSQIRFGDASPEDDQQPSPISRTLSSILLSLPPGLLDQLFNHPALASKISWPMALKILREVIEERERRRRKGVSSQVKGVQNSTVDNHLMDNLRTEERLEAVEPTPLHPSGYRLVALWSDERS